MLLGRLTTAAVVSLLLRVARDPLLNEHLGLCAYWHIADRMLPDAIWKPLVRYLLESAKILFHFRRGSDDVSVLRPALIPSTRFKSIVAVVAPLRGKATVVLESRTV